MKIFNKILLGLALFNMHSSIYTMELPEELTKNDREFLNKFLTNYTNPSFITTRSDADLQRIIFISQDIIDNPKELETYSNTLQNTYVALKKNKAHIRTIFSEMIIKAIQELRKRNVPQKKSTVPQLLRTYVKTELWPDTETKGSFIRADVDLMIKSALYDATIALGDNKWIVSLQNEFNVSEKKIRAVLQKIIQEILDELKEREEKRAPASQPKVEPKQISPGSLIPLKKIVQAEINGEIDYLNTRSNYTLESAIELVKKILNNKAELITLQKELQISEIELTKILERIKQKASVALKRAQNIAQAPAQEKEVQKILLAPQAPKIIPALVEQPEEEIRPNKLYIGLDIKELNSKGQRIRWETPINGMIAKANNAKFDPNDYFHITHCMV